MYSNRKRGIRPLGFYLPRVLKFYNIKNERLTPVVFVFVLAISFTSNLIQMNLASDIKIPAVPLNIEEMRELLKTLLVVNGVNLGASILMSLLTSVYLYAYIRDLRGISYTTGECWAVLGRKMVALTALTIINILALFAGLLLFIIPGIIIYTMFIFGSCFMVDKNKGVIGSLRSSIDLTNGSKAQIFSVILMFNLLIILVPALFGLGGGPLIYAFISAFISSIVNLMFQRLIALMYVDLIQP